MSISCVVIATRDDISGETTDQLKLVLLPSLSLGAFFFKTQMQLSSYHNEMFLKYHLDGHKNMQFPQKLTHAA